MTWFKGSHHTSRSLSSQQVRYLCGLLWFLLLRDTLWSVNPWEVSSLQLPMQEWVVLLPGSWLWPVLPPHCLAGQGTEIFTQNSVSYPCLEWQSRRMEVSFILGVSV